MQTNPKNSIKVYENVVEVIKCCRSHKTMSYSLKTKYVFNATHLNVNEGFH